MEFFWPVLILGIIALVFGVALAFAGIRLAVKVNPKEERVRELIAGANCGACGFAGCAAFSKALVEGKATLSACPVTSAKAKCEISEILGINAGIEEIKIISACGGGKNCADKFEYTGLPDCKSANAVQGGFKMCSFGCLGFGNCAKVCPAEAITVNENGFVEVLQEKCIKCGKCVLECPRKIIGKFAGNQKVCALCKNTGKGIDVKKICGAGCIACGLCVKVCPEHAITLVENLPEIDANLCTNCGTCVEKCPMHTIKNIL